MKKKGFTLIELLAVIVILAIVALITIPLVLGVIDRVQIASYKESLRSLFTATDLYIASRNFVDFPEEGINIMDADIEVKNKNFTSGKIFENEDGVLELDKVSNGKYCAGGTYDNIVIVTGSCDALDITPPTITIASNLVTSSSITIVANAEDLESGINGYQFSKDNGITWTTKQISNVYNFTGLTSNTNYTFKVRVYNNNELSTVSEQLVVTTNDIAIPTYSINTTDWTHEKIVTIRYPERQTGLVYEYSLDGAITWILVEAPSTTKEITFTDNGSVIARISDGTNEISGASYAVTNIDTTPPVITVNPINVTIYQGSNYVDSGISAIDDMLGNITSSIITTGSVNVNQPGTYILTYNVSDLAGNEAVTKTRTIEVIQTIYNFNYTGNSQTFSVPYSGNYKIELWGAQGGGDSTAGKGSYTTGNISLSSGINIYVYVGEAGMSGNYKSDETITNETYPTFNGGGAGGLAGGPYFANDTLYRYTYGSSGGGATDVRLAGGNWDESNSLKTRIMVAAGSAGATATNNLDNGNGVAGGLTGYTGNTMTAYPDNGGIGATQNSGYMFGKGQNGGNGPQTGGTGFGYCHGHHGGGGGYYGGFGGISTGGSCYRIGGGGGSSFISGHTGCNAINSSGSHTGQPNHYSGYVFNNTEMIPGNLTMPNPAGGTMTGKSGNGYARITFIP